jgi:5-methylcytosine-specific restriction endonuclease McrA
MFEEVHSLDAWSFVVKNRDKKCLVCGTRNKLHAHHLLSKFNFPEHVFDLNNGVTLCSTCHMQVHAMISPAKKPQKKPKKPIDWYRGYLFSIRQHVCSSFIELNLHQLQCVLGI